MRALRPEVGNAFIDLFERRLQRPDDMINRKINNFLNSANDRIAAINKDAGVQLLKMILNIVSSKHLIFFIL